MQKSDVVYWESPRRVGVRKNPEWLSEAAHAANCHRRTLRTLVGVSDADIFQVNVFSLHCLGTSKKNMLAQISKVLTVLGGVSLVFYPVIPKKIQRTTVQGVPHDDAAVGASESDSDVDDNTHDFTADGVLPEALTQMHLVKSDQKNLPSSLRISMRSVPK